MQRPRLDARQCVCCGICVDVCAPRALGSRRVRAECERGEPVAGLASYPYLSSPIRCDGCGDCVRQCPADALRLVEAAAA